MISQNKLFFRVWLVLMLKIFSLCRQIKKTLEFSRTFWPLILAKNDVRDVQEMVLTSVRSLKIYWPESKLIFHSACSVSKHIHADLLTEWLGTKQTNSFNSSNVSHVVLSRLLLTLNKFQLLL